MIQWAPIRTRRNIFNVFEKGKDYFYLRAGIEAILLAYLLVQCGLIVNSALGIYPTVVRDSQAQTYVGVPSQYRTTADEMIQRITSVVETLYLRTEAGNTDALLRPLVASAVRSEVLGTKMPAGGYIQTATVTRVIPNQGSSRAFTAYIQVEFELNTFDRVFVDTGYFSIQLLRGPATKTNFSGWVLTGYLEVPKDFFLRETNRLMPNADPEPALQEQKLADVKF